MKVVKFVLALFFVLVVFGAVDQANKAMDIFTGRTVELRKLDVQMKELDIIQEQSHALINQLDRQSTALTVDSILIGMLLLIGLVIVCITAIGAFTLLSRSLNHPPAHRAPVLIPPVYTGAKANGAVDYALVPVAVEYFGEQMLVTFADGHQEVHNAR